MAWRPLVEADDRRAAIASIVREIVGAIEATPPVAGDALPRALLRSYAARGGIVDDPENRSDAALALAVRGVAGTRSPALFGGLAGVGWHVAHLADGDTAEAVCSGVDDALASKAAGWRGAYDLIAGVVGSGVYALERGVAGEPLALRVLDHLERTARPRGRGVAWHTAPALLVAQQRANAPDGYWNLGLAHGLAGVIALLARFVVRDIGAIRARTLLAGAVAALIDAASPGDDGCYPCWHAGRPDDACTRTARPENRARLAWCYNDLGIALALFAAAHAAGNASWREAALELARRCASCPVERAQVLDTCVCHGAIGAAHLFHRLFRATGDAGFAAAAARWLDRALAMRVSSPYGGFPSRVVTGGVPRWVPDASLLVGATGVALVLCAMISDVEPDWDSLLLADLPLA